MTIELAVSRQTQFRNILPVSTADRFTGQQQKLRKHAGTFMRRVE
jgi:hypothetical protein